MIPSGSTASGASGASTANGGAPLPGTGDGRRAYGAMGVVSVQLALALLVIWQYELQSRTFFHVMLLGAAGFVIHALLPLKYRLSFFTLLSLASIVVALGPADGFVLIVLGLLVIGISHLPVRLGLRIALILGTAALFACWRIGWLPAAWSPAIWPILASMFMFRMALYLHSMHHAAKRPTPLQGLAYFFMLPNVCFPLYPVIDYDTFAATYYDRDAVRIYQTGIKWIVRGLIHLILYRFVYLYLAGDPVDLLTLGDVVQYILATFLLYLRVSGQFHLVAGVLHLFGFRLPETHRFYYLASSFTDFWRRINIYWKDFMMKLVYYPCYFRLRRRGTAAALVLATFVVFLLTWLLHSYQWFWLSGGFPLQAQDALFWGLLCVLVVYGSLREMKRTTRRRLGRGPVWDVSLALRRVGTFAAICILWSIWSAESLMSWLMLSLAAGNATGADFWLLGGLVAGGLLIAGLAWPEREIEGPVSPSWYRRPAVLCTTMLAGVLLLGKVDLYARQSPRLARIVASLQRSQLNARDAALQHKGYYENLDHASRMSAQPWREPAQRPANWRFSLGRAEHHREDFLFNDLRPDQQEVVLGQRFTTNHWGLRDRECPLEKPAGTYRIAILGPSFVMGSGVADGETFSDLLEERLNQMAGPDAGVRYEVLNFGVATYSLLQQLAMLHDRVLAFHPDAVLITECPVYKGPVVQHLERVISSRIPIPYPALDAMVRQAGFTSLDRGYPVPFRGVRTLLGRMGIQTRIPWIELDRRLHLASDEIVTWTLHQMALSINEHGAVPVFLMLDTVSDPPAGEVRLLKDAHSSGFLVFNLLDLWMNRDQSALVITPWDNHPNAAGNRLIAERLVELVRQHQAKLHLQLVERQRGSH